MAKPEITTLYKYFNERREFIIPIYQRDYNWKSDNVIKFIDDIYKFGKRWVKQSAQEKSYVHQDEKYFVGTIIAKPLTKGGRPVTVIVDGQQRLTTTLLILKALSNYSNDRDKNAMIDMIMSKNSESPKVVLNRLKNSDTLLKIVQETNDKKARFTDEEKRCNIYKNYDTIKTKFSQLNLSDKESYNYFSNGLYQTLAFEVLLSDDDNPSEIFETINTSALELYPSDLIKNYIFFYSYELTSAEENEATSIYEDQIEKMIGTIDDQSRFFRHLIPIKWHVGLPRKGIHIYKEFKKLCSENSLEFKNKNVLFEFLKELSLHASIYQKLLHNPYDQDPDISLFHKIFFNSFETYYVLAHKILINFYNHNTAININEKDFYRSVLKLISKYIIYAFLCGEREKTITRDIPMVYHRYEKDNPGKFNISDFEKWFTQVDNSCKMKTIVEVENRALLTNVYSDNEAKTKLALISSNLGHTLYESWKNLMDKDKFSIEHIMPQKALTSDKAIWWRNMLLADFNNDTIKISQYFDTHLHTIGNLTLVISSEFGNVNSVLSTKPFVDKQKVLSEKTELLISKDIINGHKTWLQNDIEEHGKFILTGIKNIFEK